MSDSFSQDIRQELQKIIPKNLSERQALIGGIFLTGKPDKGMRFSLSHKVKTGAPQSEIDYIRNLLNLVGFKNLIRELKSGTEVVIEKTSEKNFIDCFIMCFAEKSADILSSSPDFLRNFLKGVFLSCGYCSDPNKTYRIELHVANPDVVSLIIWMLHSSDIEPSLSVKEGKTIIRFRDGDSIATFFALIGASKAYLDFEAIRVDKDVKSRVNRLVNCDVGNSKRQADASARRSELFEKLLASPESSSLPKELLMAAQVHIANPGSSIAELGKMMNPPIGKSGMNHRLAKLEEIAKGL